MSVCVCVLDLKLFRCLKLQDRLTFAQPFSRILYVTLMHFHRPEACKEEIHGRCAPWGAFRNQVPSASHALDLCGL